jgi:pimeloyl-ACP methyl ester carboxylesterase
LTRFHLEEGKRTRRADAFRVDSAAVKLPSFQILKANGIDVRAAVEGKGPLCILVHGFPESWYSYRHQIAPLVEAGYRVCVPDVRGYGGSDKPDAIFDYDMTHLTADVVGLIDALGEEQAILIGHDWGAPIVWTTSILHRKRIRAVVGLSVPHLGRGPMSVIELFKQIYKDRFFYQLYFQEPGVAEKELERDPKVTIRKMYYGCSGDASDAEQGAFSAKGPRDNLLADLTDPAVLPKWLTQEDVDYYAGEFAKNGFRGPLNRYRAQDKDWADHPQLSEEKVTQPALFVVGSRDPVLRFVPGVSLLDVMDHWYADLRGKVVVEGAGHWVQQERPEEVNRALLEFLRGI